MSRENATYRDELEPLLEFFGNKRVLSVSDVSRYTGRSREWCKSTYGIDPAVGISVISLAHKLSETG